MKANELRVGNYYRCKIYNGNNDAILPFTWQEYKYIHLFEGIPLTPEILEAAGFEDWGSEVINEWETCHYYAIHNFIEGTSDIKVCFITSNYGDSTPYSEWVFKIDNDTIYNKGLEYFHQLQNVIFALTHQELTINLHATAL